MESLGGTASARISSSIVKTSYTCVTSDNWTLSVVRSQLPEPKPPANVNNTPNPTGSIRYPVLLVPGLGSSAKFSFDVDSESSLVEWLARRGWDVWMAELRGNGNSDKSLLGVRSRWWTIDDNAEKDLPAVISAVCRHTGAPMLHALGHSMGGMIMTRVLGRHDATSARIRSFILLGSGCFLQGSWWQAMEAGIGAAAFLYSVPAGAALNLYSNLAFTNVGSGFLDRLYFYPANTDPERARTVLANNFSAISPGVILQMRTAFWPRGLLTMQKSADNKIDSSTPAAGARPSSTQQRYSQLTGQSGAQLLHLPHQQAAAPYLTVPEAAASKSKRIAFADPETLSRVKTPVFAIVGDRDRMCPPKGVRRTFELFTGSQRKRFTELGPVSGAKYHYGHFDILMGHHVKEEVFPKIEEWLLEMDSCEATENGVFMDQSEDTEAGAYYPGMAIQSRL